VSPTREMEERRLACALVEAYNGCSLAAAARIVGIGTQRARSLLRRYNVRTPSRVRRHGGRIPDSLDPRTATNDSEAAARKAALAELADGMSMRSLAEALGTSLASVKRLLDAAGIRRRRGRPPSLDPGELARLRAAGWSYQDIADLHGCSREAVALAYCDGRHASRRIDPGTVVRLRDEHGYPWSAVGLHLGCHPDTAKKLYYAARRRSDDVGG